MSAPDTVDLLIQTEKNQVINIVMSTKMTNFAD